MTFEAQRAQSLEQDLKEVSKLAKKVDKGFFPMKHRASRTCEDDFVEETPASTRKISKRRKRLSVRDKVTIAHQVLVDYEK
jgi:hypothetical protein